MLSLQFDSQLQGIHDTCSEQGAVFWGTGELILCDKALQGTFRYKVELEIYNPILTLPHFGILSN